MTPLKALLYALALLGLSTFSSAFTPSPAFGVRQSSYSQQAPLVSPLQMSDDKEGGAAIAKPKVGVKTTTVTETKQKARQKQRAKTQDPKNRRDEEFEDAPLYKVMLLGDEGYDIGHVIERMCDILEDMDEDAASTIFNQAQIAGKAMCGKYPFEHAEMYKEQLARSDPMIYSDIEEENKKQ